MGIGVFALIFAMVALVVGSFAGRFSAARLLGVSDVGIFGPQRVTAGASVSALRRLGVHAGGPLGAYAFPVVLFTVAFLMAGEPVATTAIQVMPETPAERAGLQDGDRITRIEGEPVADWETMRQALSGRPNLPTRVEVERDGQPRTLEVTPNAQGENGRAVIGVKPVMERRPMGLGRSLARGAVEPLRVVQMQVVAFARLFAGVEKPSFAGSGAVAREIDKAHDRGLGDAFYVIALIAAYVWPGFVVLELILAAAMWRSRRQQPREASDRP